MNRTASILIMLLLAPSALCAQSKPAPAPVPDSTAIRQCALDYIEGWYEADPDRMERALHPDLAKRIVRTTDGRSRLDQMSAMSLVQGVRARRDRPRDGSGQKDVTILDIFENVASVKVVASDWIDYMHIARFNNRWVIVNVLWEMKPKKS
jgi:hypothetical protein